VIGRPSTHTYLAIVDNNLLPNCPVTRTDILAAEVVFGPYLGSLKGKTVRKDTDHVHPEYENIPRELMELYQDVTIAGDLMFVNKIAIFICLFPKI
jgi:hypothetical protein